MGFLPRKPELRLAELRKLNLEKRAMILMETPYRVHQLIDELSLHLNDRKLLLGLDLSTPSEKILEGWPQEVKKLNIPAKPECVLMIQPHKQLRGPADR
jgi:16S rRNA (cytidine1402-2'-O)-methyltransferase